MKRLFAIILCSPPPSPPAVLASLGAGGDAGEQPAVHGRARQRLRPDRGRRREGRRRARGQDQAASRSTRRPTGRSSRSQITAEGLRRPAQGRLLRVAPAVADRRVLPRLPARHGAGEAQARRDASRSSRPARRSPSTWSTTSCAGPYRERFSILLGELGAALAARGEDLNETIRRANPALRETDKVLRRARRAARVIRDLTDDAERVVAELADKRTDVTRFVREARDTVSARRPSATTSCAAQFQTLPDLPARAAPDDAAARRGRRRASARRCANLVGAGAAAEALLRRRSARSREASRPGVPHARRRRRAPAARAVKARAPADRRAARRSPRTLPEVATTSRSRSSTSTTATSPSRRTRARPAARASPASRRSSSTSSASRRRPTSSTRNSYLLKVSAFLDNTCAQYADADAAPSDPDKQYCRAILGPNQPGIDQPDPTAPPTAKAKRRARGDDGRARAPTSTPKPSDDKPGKQATPLPDLNLPPEVQELLDGLLGGGTLPNGAAADRPRLQATSAALLDFLLGS